jgi:hypothetical protein
VALVASQQPLGQLIASQTQLSPSQRCPVSHVWHVAPLSPQALGLVPRLHCPVASQQPVGQLVASQTHCPA